MGFVWNPVRTAPGDSGKVETLYGIGAFTGTDRSEDIIVNIVQEKPLKVNKDGTGYEDDGRVVLNLVIDNTSPYSVNLENVKITLKFQDKEYDDEGNVEKWPELYVESGKEEDEVISVGNIAKGTVTGTIPVVLKAKPQDESIVRKVIFELSYEGQTSPVIASKLVTLPSIKNKMPALSLLSVTPSKIYYDGASVITITGSKSEGSDEAFSLLQDKSAWKVYLVREGDNLKVPVDTGNISVDVKNRQITFVVDMEGIVGRFKVHVDFTGEALRGIPNFVSPGYVESVTDEQYKSKGYSIVAVVRKGDRTDFKYEIVCFSQSGASSPEMQFEEYQEEILDDEKDEVLIEVRGVFNPEYSGDKIVGYNGLKTTDPININRILHYKSNTPLSVKKETIGGVEHIVLRGDGDLSVVSALTIWQWQFEIDIDTSRYMSYDTGDYQESNEFNSVPQLQLLGLGYVVQNLHGLFFDLKYGELGKTDDGRYTVDFGGSMSVPLGFDSSAFKKANTASGGTSATPSPAPSSSASSGASSPATPGSSSSSGTPSGSSSGKSSAKKAIKEFANNNKDKIEAFDGKFAANVDSVLFGERPDKEPGFIGVAVTVEFELPEGILPGGGKENSDPALISATQEANLTADQEDISEAMHRLFNEDDDSGSGTGGNTDSKPVSKPSGKLKGFEMGLSINTYENEYKLDLGVEVGPIKSALRISFREVDKYPIMLDEFYFELAGFSIPIISPVLALNGLGGGFSGLAETLNGGNSLPPLTIYVMAMMKLAEFVYLRGDLSASATNFDLTISGAPVGFDEIQFMGYMSANWSSGFRLALGVNVNIVKLIQGGVSIRIVTSPEFSFLGVGTVSLSIPGLGDVASAKVAMSDKYIGGAVKILIFEAGVLYYFKPGHFTFTSFSEIDNLVTTSFEELELDDDDDDKSGAKALKNSNINSFLTLAEVTDPTTGEKGYMAFGLGAKAIATTNKDYIPVDGRIAPYALLEAKNPNVFEFDVTSEMANDKSQYLALRIDYDKGEKPVFTAVKPSGEEYRLIAFDRSQTQEWNDVRHANLVYMSEPDKDYAYITIPVDQIQAGKWTITAGETEITGTLFTMPLPASVQSVTAEYDKDSNRIIIRDIKINGAGNAKVSLALVPVDSEGNPVKETIMNDDGTPMTEKYTDENGKTQYREIQVEHAGYPITESMDVQNVVGSYSIPDNMTSGSYKIKVEVMSLNGCIYTSGIIDDFVVEFSNPYQLAMPTNVKLTPAGDGGLLLEADVDSNADGVICTIFERVITGYKTQNGARVPEYGYRTVKGVGGYIAAENGHISTVLKGTVTMTDSYGVAEDSDGLTPGKEYSVKLVSVVNDPSSPYLASEFTQNTEYVKIPIPNPPAIDVKITQAGNGAELLEKTDESTGYSYLKSVDQDMRLVYTITNPDTADPKLCSFETEIYIDNMLFGDIVVNNENSGYKGYANFSLSDGEHYVRLVTKNGYGDKNVYSTKIVIDSTPPDLKLDKPTGELINPGEGITVSGQTEYGARLLVSIDGGEEYVLTDRDINSDGTFQVTRPVTDKTKLEYNVLVTATDSSGNKTEAVVKVNNVRMQEMKSIKLKPIKSQDSSAVEIYAVALDGNGNDMFRIPKENLKWQLYGDEEIAYFDTRSQGNVVLIPKSDSGDYAVSATWKIREDFSLTDVLMKDDINRQGESEQKSGNTGTGGSDSGMTGGISGESVYRNVVAAFRKEMSNSAAIWAIPVYPRIDNNINKQGLKVSIPNQSLTQSDYLILARDPDTSRYEPTLQQGMKFVSDIVQFQTVKHDSALPGQYTVTIPYDSSDLTDMRSLSVYAYSEKLGRWIRINSEVDPINHVMTFTSQYFGRFAVIENSRTIEFRDVNSLMWSASRINALALADIISGYYGQDGLLYFAPKREITRGEFIKLLVAASGEKLDSSADLSAFADADSIPEWQKPYVRKAVEKGWLKGRAAGNGTISLAVNSPITREEAFTLIYRALICGVPDGVEKAGFTDMDSVSDFAVDAVNYLASVNIVSGNGNGKVLPKNNITREETAKILYECIRLLAYMKR